MRKFVAIIAGLFVAVALTGAGTASVDPGGGGGNPIGYCANVGEQRWIYDGKPGANYPFSLYVCMPWHQWLDVAGT